MTFRTFDLDACMDAHGPWVIQMAFRYLGNRQDAQDLAQDVFVKLFAYRQKIQHSRDIRPLLKTITVNCCLKKLKKTQPNLSLDRMNHESVFGNGTDADWESKASLRMDLHKALCRLTAHERMALLLTAYEGMSTREAGKALSCRAGTIKSLCFRARTKMKAFLTGREP